MPASPRLDLVHKAICAGQIEWKDRCLRRFRADPDMRSFTDKGVRDALWDLVKDKGGQLQCRRETDPDWLAEHPDDPWWYFAVIPTPGVFKHGLFVKVKLLWEDGDDEDEAFVQIVSIHEEKKL